MTHRTCTCGARIVCADLDGWTVWLDPQSAVGGMFTVLPGAVDIPHITVDPGGRRRRHTCHATEPAPSTRAPHPTNAARSAEAAARNTPRIAAILDGLGDQLPARTRLVAQLRIDHPTASNAELAAMAGMSKTTYSTVLYRLLRRRGAQRYLATTRVGEPA